MSKYLAVVRKEDDSDFGVEFPDLPGCFSAGSDLDEAKEMAAEALSFHLEGLIGDGVTVPEPSSLGNVGELLLGYGAGADFVAVLEVDSELTAKRVRINITMSVPALAAIDAAAEREGVSRSAFLQRAGRKLADAD